MRQEQMFPELQTSLRAPHRLTFLKKLFRMQKLLEWFTAQANRTASSRLTLQRLHVTKWDSKISMRPFQTQMKLSRSSRASLEKLTQSTRLLKTRFLPSSARTAWFSLADLLHTASTTLNLESRRLQWQLIFSRMERSLLTCRFSICRTARSASIRILSQNWELQCRRI